MVATVATLATLGCVEKPKQELVLSNYPKLFEKDVIIVIGENASQIEMEGAQAIAENLSNLTGNVPMIRKDVEITEKEKAGYNLIIVGRPDENSVLVEVYERTNATRVTKEYPGAWKGVLEILRSPWNEEKAMLLVAGSDEWGVKAGVERAEQLQGLEKNNLIVKWKRNDTKIEDSRILVVPKTVDSDGNRIADDLEKKLKNDTYKRIDGNLADIIVSLDHAPSATDETQIKKFGGKVYEKWDKLVYAIHASLPVSNITTYLSQHPDVVLIEEHSEMHAVPTNKI